MDIEIGIDIDRLLSMLALVMVAVFAATMGFVALSAMWAGREPRAARKRTTRRAA